MAMAELGGLWDAPVPSCAALRPFLSVPPSKSVQNKVDSILVSVSAVRWAEGAGMVHLHLSPLQQS